MLRTIASVSAHNKDLIYVVQLVISLSVMSKTKIGKQPNKYTAEQTGTYIHSPFPSVSIFIVLDFQKIVLRYILVNVWRSTLHNPISVPTSERETHKKCIHRQIIYQKVPQVQRINSNKRYTDLSKRIYWQVINQIEETRHWIKLSLAQSHVRNHQTQWQIKRSLQTST